MGSTVNFRPDFRIPDGLVDRRLPEVRGSCLACPDRLSSLRSMNRAVVSVLLAAGVAVAAVGGTARAAEVDAQDVLILKQTVQTQQEALDSLRLRIAALETQNLEARREIDTVRRANAALSRDLVTQEQLKALAAKLEQVDTNRRRDSERLVEAMKKIVDTPLPPPVHHPAPERSPKRPPADAADADSGKPDGKPAQPAVELPSESYQHVVKPDETLSEILIAYRKEYGLKTSIAHVVAANPGLNPNRLKSGKTIIIPAVK